MQSPSEKTNSDDNIYDNAARRRCENGAKKAYRLDLHSDTRPSYSTHGQRKTNHNVPFVHGEYHDWFGDVKEIAVERLRQLSAFGTGVVWYFEAGRFAVVPTGELCADELGVSGDERGGRGAAKG
jgi:hypothetical protein